VQKKMGGIKGVKMYFKLGTFPHLNGLALAEHRSSVDSFK